MTYPLLSRTEARNQGRKHFYTGKPCIHKHVALRFTSTGGCMACNAARSQLFSKSVAANTFSYALHPDDVAAALAYCQALDLQRGRVPKGAAAPPIAAPAALPADIARHRATLVANLSQPAIPDYLPRP